MCGRYARQLAFEITEAQRAALNDLDSELVDVIMQREPAHNICPLTIQPVIARDDDGVAVKGLR